MMNAGLGAIAPRNPNPMASQPQPFQQLLALNEAVKTANLQRAAQGQQAMEQAQQMSPTIYDQLKMALQQAQAQQPVPGMARGGMVAFDKGGLAEADLEGFDEDLVAEEESWERELRRTQGEEVSDPGAGSVWRAIGRALTYNSDVAAQREREAQERAAYPEPRAIRESKPPAGLAAAAAAATPPAGPTPPARPPAARTAGGAAGAGAGAGGAAAPQRGGLAEYLRMTEQLAKDVEGTAAVDPRVLEARQAYDAMLKASMDPAEQQMRELEAQQGQNIFENPELMSAILEGMRGTDRLGDTLMGAATGLVKARAGQQKGRREAQANLVKLRQELARAEAEARLARAEKDVEGERRAKLKAAEIRAAMNEKYTELEIKQTTANAAATAAANRPTAEQRGRLTQEDLARIYGQVSKELRGSDVIKAQVIRAKAQASRTGAPFNEEEYLQNLIQAEFENRIGAQPGRTMSPTSGQASAAPGASADPLGIR